jgi:hypothetical protein
MLIASLVVGVLMLYVEVGAAGPMDFVGVGVVGVGVYGGI